jgi:hypothetical protein
MYHENGGSGIQLAYEMATRGFVEASRIANLWPRDRFLDWVHRRRSERHP